MMPSLRSASLEEQPSLSRLWEIKPTMLRSWLPSSRAALIRLMLVSRILLRNSLKKLILQSMEFPISKQALSFTNRLLSQKSPLVSLLNSSPRTSNSLRISTIVTSSFQESSLSSMSPLRSSQLWAPSATQTSPSVAQWAASLPTSTRPLPTPWSSPSTRRPSATTASSRMVPSDFASASLRHSLGPPRSTLWTCSSSINCRTRRRRSGICRKSAEYHWRRDARSQIWRCKDCDDWKDDNKD